MAHDVCPWWMGYLLASPIRRLMENPQSRLGEHIRPGMRVLEPGCAMGFFTLDIARMVGPAGKVVALDLQQRMLDSLGRRAIKAGLADRIDIRKVDENGLGISDLAASMDLAAIIYVAHEVPDQAGFFKEVYDALKPGAGCVFIEPGMHVAEEEMAASLDLAQAAGFELKSRQDQRRARRAFLQKPV